MGFSFFFLKRNKSGKSAKGAKWKLLIMLFFMYEVIAYITAGRNENLDENSSIIGTLIGYYIAPFSFLNYYLEHPDYSLLGVEHMTYGTCIIGCIYNFFCTVATFLFKVPYAGTDYIITALTQVPVPVAKSWELNAACTAVYPFMKDFGFFGVIIGFTLCALLTVNIKKNYFKNPTLRNGALYVYILFTIFRLSEQYDFLFPSALATLLYIYIGTFQFRKAKKITVFNETKN